VRPEGEDVVAGDGDVRYESVFRERWRDRQSAGARPGELIRQPRWIDASLAALGALLVVGAVAAATVTVARTEAMPAVAQGAEVTAVRGGEVAPEVGTTAQFRETSGTTFDAVVVQVTATEVMAELPQPVPAVAGQLVVGAGRQRLIGILLPRLG